MKERVKSDKPPKSAMALYVKIYCQKQGRPRNWQNSLEATKSWVSLDKTAKQYFISMFEGYETKMRKCFASNLQNAQLYMKKLHHKRLSNKTTSFQIPKDNNNDIGKDDGTEINHDNEQFGNYSSAIPLENETYTSRDLDEPKIISEPTPPVRSSMELFEMIKHNDESSKNSNWADLTKLQKQRYNRALLRIKQDFIKQYTAYLEQLTPEQLFHHYQSNS